MKEKHFKFRESFGTLVQGMADKQAGEFIKSVCDYVFGGKPFESKDEYLKGVFIHMQNVLDNEIRNRENGRLGGVLSATKCRDKEDSSSQIIIVASCETDDLEEMKQLGNDGDTKTQK